MASLFRAGVQGPTGPLATQRPTDPGPAHRTGELHLAEVDDFPPTLCPAYVPSTRSITSPGPRVVMGQRGLAPRAPLDPLLT